MLENLVKESWAQDEFSIGMAFSSDSTFCYQVAAIMDLPVKLEKVNEQDKSWGWKTPDRHYHKK